MALNRIISLEQKRRGLKEDGKSLNGRGGGFGFLAIEFRLRTKFEKRKSKRANFQEAKQFLPHSRTRAMRSTTSSIQPTLLRHFFYALSTQKNISFICPPPKKKNISPT